jgi:iron(III) transport system substrate-binding protein
VPASLKISALAGAVALTAALASCSTGAPAPSSSSGSATPTSPAALATLAQQEHGLVIYSNAPTQYFEAVIAGFNMQYPTIKVTVTTLADNTVFSKYEAEAAQGARTADLLVASAPASWVQAEQNGVSAGFTPAGLSAFPSWVNQGGGVMVMSAEPALLVYNPKLLKASQVPKTWAQLAADAKADPAKYRLVSYPISNPLDYGGIYGLIHVLGASKVWNYYTALAQIIQGGASVGYMSSGLAQGVLQHYKGLVSYTFLQDATPLIPRGIAVSKDAASPASARLFLDYLYTKAGQDALCQGGFEASMSGYQAANGCTASLTALQSQVPAGTTYLVPISQAVLDQQSSITTRWNQAFHR